MGIGLSGLIKSNDREEGVRFFITAMIISGNRTEWSAIQGVI